MALPLGIFITVTIDLVAYPVLAIVPQLDTKYSTWDQTAVI